MPRTKSTGSRKHRKVLKEAKGYKFAASRRIKAAKEAVLHAGQYAYVGRRLRKRDMRKLWITRINAGARANGLSYSKLMSALKSAKIEIDRKILADIAARDPESFKAIVDKAKTSK